MICKNSEPLQHHKQHQKITSPTSLDHIKSMCIFLYICNTPYISYIYISSHFPLQKQHDNTKGTFVGVRSSGMGGTEESLDTSRGAGGVAGAKAFTLGGWVNG